MPSRWCFFEETGGHFIRGMAVGLSLRQMSTNLGPCDLMVWASYITRILCKCLSHLLIPSGVTGLLYLSHMVVR